MIMAAKKTTDDEKVQKAKLAFLASVADLSWKMAGLFMLPVIVGFFIDTARGSDNFVVAGTMIGFVFSIIFIIKLGVEASRK